jgi:hypothetical protein
MISARGGSREWTRVTKQFCAGKTCWLRFPRCTIAATSIDHYWPQYYRPDLADDPGNWRPACNYCNRARRHTLPQLIPRLRAKLEAEALRRRVRVVRTSNALGFFK